MCKVTQFDTIPVKIRSLIIVVDQRGGGAGIQSDMSTGDWLEHITQFAKAIHSFRLHCQEDTPQFEVATWF